MPNTQVCFLSNIFSFAYPFQHLNYQNKHTPNCLFSLYQSSSYNIIIRVLAKGFCIYLWKCISHRISLRRDKISTLKTSLQKETLQIAMEAKSRLKGWGYHLLHLKINCKKRICHNIFSTFKLVQKCVVATQLISFPRCQS